MTEEKKMPSRSWIITYLAVTIGLGGGAALAAPKEIVDLVLERYLLLAVFTLTVVSLALADYVDEMLHERKEEAGQ